MYETVFNPIYLQSIPIYYYFKQVWTEVKYFFQINVI